MRGDSQAASGRLPLVVPGRRWSSWIAQAARRRRRLKLERLEVIERLAREERGAGRSRQYVPDPRLVRPWR